MKKDIELELKYLKGRNPTRIVTPLEKPTLDYWYTRKWREKAAEHLNS